MSEYVANLSTIYRGLTRDARPQAAARDGYATVESWWEFDSATPAASETSSFCEAIAQAGVQLSAINSHGGDRDAGERGLAGLPDRVAEFKDSIHSLKAVAQVTGARAFNVTFGLMDAEKWTPQQQFETAAENYAWAANVVGEFGGTILIEALAGAGNPGYPFTTGRDVVDFCDRYLPGVANVRFLFDTFHLASNGQDVLAVFAELADRIGHVQYADYPGRGAPGTAGIDFDALNAAISRSQYRGRIALEYLGPVTQ